MRTVSALEAIPPASERYFFWTGGSKLQTATSDRQAKLKRLFESAGICARQEQAEAGVRRTWAQDPVALLESKGTPEVHGKTSAVN
ncbi:MAG TPA: hypothetical protein VN875_16570 [Candidatus Binatus sp.]|nr:hypothetical protein [Candidatus Binatus sp.]